MKTLFLLRHAKSSWDDPGCADFDRPLNNRGQAAALAIGAHIKDKGLIPDLIISSPSARTRETLERLQKGMARQVFSQYPKILYLASPETILNTIRTAADSVARLMIAGHNPGLHQLALSLAGTGARRDIDNLSAKYPTGSLLEITFPVDAWVDIGPGGGRLVRFIKPRGL
ncbi:MAG: histidine phosphatase family protein [Proteobacteria bacterium]|nr:histidine phosphatase family protein [Pseudomonadota bacterium]MCH8321671.1 histidine phosphatase family protein [Pseudomonadota bacterium]